MDYSATLNGFAQLSLVLTGFVAVFIAFFAEKRTSTKPDVHHAMSMLIGSVIALLTALVPLVLEGYGLRSEKLWTWSSVAGLILSVSYGSTMLNLTLRLSRDEFRRAGLVHMFSSYSLGTAAGALMAWNLFGIPGPGHYMLALLCTFLVALIGFVSFSLQNFLKL